MVNGNTQNKIEVYYADTAENRFEEGHFYSLEAEIHSVNSESESSQEKSMLLNYQFPQQKQAFSHRNFWVKHHTLNCLPDWVNKQTNNRER